MTDTTTELLKIHEREKQVRPRRENRRILLNTLELAIELSAECDKETPRILGLTKKECGRAPRFKVVRVDLRKRSPAPRGGLMHLLKHVKK